jgi:CelD/BcsL family acetyltransferase involved in cellulose biosynthesis
MNAMPIAEGASAPTVWRSRTIHLRYSLSYVKLIQVAFRAFEDVRPFDPDRPVISSLPLPSQEIPTGHDALVIRHQLLAAPLPVISYIGNTLCYVPRQLPHFYTDLRGGPDEAFKSMSSKTRATIVRKVRHYETFSGGEIRWRVYRKPEELSEFHRLAADLSRKTYQARLFDSGLPDTDAFRAGMLDLAARDLVRAFMLFHCDVPVAYLYTPAPDGFLVYEYLGYDPVYAEHSPGTVLQYLALKHLHAEGRFPIYYWGYGHSQTKRIFSTREIVGADLFYFRPTLRNRLAIHAHYGIDRLAESAGNVLSRLRLKHAIKTWLKK